jgi:hypothetical protein
LWRGLPLPISGEDGKTIGDRHRVVIVAAPTNCHVWLSASRRHHERETHPREAEHDKGAALFCRCDDFFEVACRTPRQGEQRPSIWRKPWRPDE